MHLLLVYYLLMVCSAYGQEKTNIIPFSIEESSKQTNISSAKRDIYRKAVEQATKEQILQMIPEEQYLKKEREIGRKILNQSGKYIPYYKITTPVKRGDLYYANVNLQLSPNYLQKLLEIEGLLFLKEGSRLVLPLITYLDQKESRSYKWWLGVEIPKVSLLWKESREFNKVLKHSFWRKDLNLMEASFAQLGALFPQAYRYETYRTEDIKFIGNYFQAQIVLLGSVKYSSSESNSLAGRIRIRLKAVLSGSGRVVAEIAKDQETAVGEYSKVLRETAVNMYETVATEMAEQIIKSWQKGLFGTSRVRLAINGNFNYKQLEGLKKQLLKQNLNIKNLKERLFAPKQVVFELDITGGGKSLAKQLREFRFAGKQFKVSDFNASKVEIDIE